MGVFLHEYDMVLSIQAKASLIYKIANDFENYIDNNINPPAENTYTITAADENVSVKRMARHAAFTQLGREKTLKKYAFDTRRIDQENSRNPRTNLQYWHRTDDFIDADDKYKLNVFAKLMNVLAELKTDYGTHPEWFESYSRVLYDNVNRILRIKQADLDIFKPQLSYLEQLLYARYRMSIEQLANIDLPELKNKILAKDEGLLNRGEYLNKTGLNEPKQNIVAVKDGNGASTNENIINAIFGNNNFRREGEKNCTRTITITIRDSVED